MSKSWSDRESLDAEYEPEPPEPPEPRAVENAPVPASPVVELGEVGPADDCPLCAQRCFCGHTLQSPWTPGEPVPCHNCGATVKPRPPALLPQPHFDNGWVGE